MSKQEVENLKLILFSVEQGDVGILHSLGIKVRQPKKSIWIYILQTNHGKFCWNVLIKIIYYSRANFALIQTKEKESSNSIFKPSIVE